MSGRRWLLILAPLLALAFLAEARIAVRRWQGNQLLAGVERDTLVASTSGRLQPRALERNLARLRIAAELDPTNVRIPIAQGAQYLLMARPEPALDAYDRALAIEARAEIYLNRGRALRLADRLDEAEASFRQAVLLDHNLIGGLRTFFQAQERARARAENGDSDRQRARQMIFTSSFELGRPGRWALRKGMVRRR